VHFLVPMDVRSPGYQTNSGTLYLFSFAALWVQAAVAHAVRNVR
jgi:hypothetical protein